jgi:hypothetical protein
MAMRPPPAPERACVILSDCWVAEAGVSGARPLGMVALEGKAGAMVFLSDISDGEEGLQRLVADMGNDPLARYPMLKVLSRLVF